MGELFTPERLKTVRHACDVEINCVVLTKGETIGITLQWDSFQTTQYFAYETLVPDITEWFTKLSVHTKCAHLIVEMITQQVSQIREMRKTNGAE